MNSSEILQFKHDTDVGHVPIVGDLIIMHSWKSAVDNSMTRRLVLKVIPSSEHNISSLFVMWADFSTSRMITFNGDELRVIRKCSDA